MRSPVLVSARAIPSRGQSHVIANAGAGPGERYHRIRELPLQAVCHGAKLIDHRVLSRAAVNPRDEKGAASRQPELFAC
jgi:hypothetical protein